ncbi:EamA family transporter [Amycolatopsis sp. NPDC050768]|uniref:EamA family transporter n=1 Tax=Amycolatopsis sp. NPDC050768 TaxID=3154839 RepID=UPI002250CD56
MAFGQVGFATVLLLLLAPLVATQPMHLSAAVVVSMLTLSVLGTRIAYVWNTRVVAAWGAAHASSVTYLTPGVGVVLGILASHGKLSLRRRQTASVAGKV